MKRVLVIDDDQSVGQWIEKLLSNSEFKVERAFNGRDGIRMLKDLNYDLIFLDINMPKVDGLQVMRILNKLNISVPVIIISGYLTKSKIISLNEIGVKGFLSKPFRVEQFYNIVNQVCSVIIPLTKLDRQKEIFEE